MSRVIQGPKHLVSLADKVSKYGAGSLDSAQVDELFALARLGMEAERNAREFLQAVEVLNVKAA